MKMSQKEILVTDENFNERAYLASNPDVAKAVREGSIESGWAHFDGFGREEKRTIRIRNPLMDLPARCLWAFGRVVRDTGGRGKTPVAKTRPRNIDIAQGGELPEQGLQVKRHRIAEEHIRGAGIEIGALNDPVRVPTGVNVRYVDRLSQPGPGRPYGARFRFALAGTVKNDLDRAGSAGFQPARGTKSPLN